MAVRLLTLTWSKVSATRIVVTECLERCAGVRLQAEIFFTTLPQWGCLELSDSNVCPVAACARAGRLPIPEKDAHSTLAEVAPHRSQHTAQTHCAAALPGDAISCNILYHVCVCFTQNTALSLY